MSFERYAIYLLPDTGALADFGAAWLGWDARTGEAAAPPSLPDLPMPLNEITARPRKYGFHGTIKPPFRLAPGQTEAELQTALRDFAAHQTAVSLEGVELAQLGRFLALVPVGDTSGLAALAADAVRQFDRFRAHLDDAELARRRQSRLTPQQDALLEKWGYPYIMEAFRFHLTLTGKLPKAKATALKDLLAPVLTPMLPAPFTIESLSLMGEGSDGMFREIERVPLTGMQ
ncbi:MULTISPECIES: DUF1045 domain-containing protein [unclassified Roseovarius]|uniref:DUF1045 domain-containing protein n=1 Tax=unclassified Roseovarius TaxID=2614913 RepID=UPI00273ECE11|nr:MULTISPECIES: DUF1045 domain-containing protein [unclassified Roseovarius]